MCRNGNGDEHSDDDGHDDHGHDDEHDDGDENHDDEGDHDEEDEDHDEEDGDHDEEDEDHDEEDEDHNEEDEGHHEDRGSTDSAQQFRLTAHQLIEEFGTDEILTQEGLEESCMAILACQVSAPKSVSASDCIIPEGHSTHDQIKKRSGAS